MQKQRLTTICLTAIFVCSDSFFGAARAQEKKEPPPRPVVVGEKEEARTSPEAKLPKIDLPEYEIRGRELIELPLTGKLDQRGLHEGLVDASRLTVLGEKKIDTLAALAEKSGARPARDYLSYDGKLNLGYGRFTSSYAEGWFGKKYGEGDFDLHGRYLAHTAYVDHADARSGSIEASGGLHLPQRLAMFGGSKVLARVAYEAENYRFYGSLTPNLKRTVSNFQVGLGLQSAPNAPISQEGSVHFRRLTLNGKDKSREDNLSFAFRASKEASGIQMRGEFYYSADFLEQSISRNDPHYLRATASFRKLFFDKLDASGSAAFFLYRNPDSGFKSKFYPNLAFQYYLDHGWSFFARFEPAVEQSSLLRLVSENRYIGNDVSIRHRDIFVDLSAGVQFNVTNRGTGRLYAKYQRIRDFPLFVDPSTLLYAAVVVVQQYPDWDANYDGTTRVVSLNGEILVDLTSADRLGGNVTLLSSHNSETDGEVPYLPPVQLSSSYTHQFPFGLSTQVSARFVGRRAVYLYSDSPKLSSYFLLNAGAEYRVHKNFTLFFHLNNIFDEHYSLWNRYQEIPFSLLGGISVRW